MGAWRASIGRTTSRWASCTSCPWQNDGSGYGNVAKAIVADWQVNGVFAAFSGSRST